MQTTANHGARCTPQFILGIIIIAVGVILTLDNLGYLYADEILRYWPVGLIAVGASKLWQSREVGSGAVAGIIFMAAGTWLLLEAAGVLRVSIRDAWPLALILIGGGIVWQGMQRRGHGVSVNANDTLSGFAILGGFARGNNSQKFRGGDLTAVMGGLEIDLRQARIEGDAVLNVFALWGGIDIRVPEDWTMVVRATPILGGVEDKTRPPQGAGGQRLVIQGLVLMGGVEIKN